jgi:hypothetical protein
LHEPLLTFWERPSEEVTVGDGIDGLVPAAFRMGMGLEWRAVSAKYR